MERSAWNDVKLSLPSKMSTSEEDDWVDLTWNPLADGKVSIIDEQFNVVFSAAVGDPMQLGKLSSSQEVADDHNTRVVTTRGGPAGTQWRFTFPNKQSAVQFDAVSTKAEEALSRQQRKAAASPADEDDHCEELVQQVQERYKNELYPPMIFRGAELFGPSTPGGEGEDRLGRGCFMLLDTKTKTKDTTIRHYNLYFFDEDDGASKEKRKFTISKYTKLKPSKDDKPEEVAEMFDLTSTESTSWGNKDVLYKICFDEKYVAALFIRDWLPRFLGKDVAMGKEKDEKEYEKNLAEKEREHQDQMSKTLGARIRQFIVFLVILLAVVAAGRFAMHIHNQNNRDEALGLLKKDIGNSADIAHGAFKKAAAGVCGATGNGVPVDALKSCLELSSNAKVNDCVAELVDRATTN